MLSSGIYKAVQHRVMSKLSVAEKHRLLFAILILLTRQLKKISDALSSDDALIKVLVWWGIILFIVGNLLQFLATF